MKFEGFNILKQIVMRREVSLGEILPLLPKTFKDHRDFYTLASLYTSGYIDSTLKKEGCNWDTSKNMLVAEEFYISTFEKGRHKYGGSEFTVEHDWKTEMKFFPTAKADLYFEEQRAKRRDRIITLSYWHYCCDCLYTHSTFVKPDHAVLATD